MNFDHAFWSSLPYFNELPWTYAILVSGGVVGMISLAGTAARAKRESMVIPIILMTVVLVFVSALGVMVTKSIKLHDRQQALGQHLQKEYSLTVENIKIVDDSLFAVTAVNSEQKKVLVDVRWLEGQGGVPEDTSPIVVNMNK